MISAKVLADSISPAGVRLTTMQVTMHRFVLAEFNTHRVFSRNFRSSRAVPVARLIEEVRTRPATPVVWLAEKKGMQGGEPLPPGAFEEVTASWDFAANIAAGCAEELMRLGLHKSWANRVIEPFLYVHGVVTSTEWSNFFALRCHPDAQPEMKILAEAMEAALAQSRPQELIPGEWHLPFIDQDDGHGHRIKWCDALDDVETAIKCSVARCARVSYSNHDGTPPTQAADLALYDRLVGSHPMHASPAEHQATPDWKETRIYHNEQEEETWRHPELHGNLRGWIQHRKTLAGECQ